MKKLFLLLTLTVISQSFGQKNQHSQYTVLEHNPIKFTKQAKMDKAIGDPIFIYAWQKSVADVLGLDLGNAYYFGNYAQNMLDESVSTNNLPYLSFDEDDLLVNNTTGPFGPKSGFKFGGFSGDSSNVIGFNYDTTVYNPAMIDTVIDTNFYNPPMVDTTYDTVVVSPLQVDTMYDTTYYALDTNYNMIDTLIDSTEVIDTVYFLRATSWFNPVAKASNWAIIGPIYIPDEGAAIYWDYAFNAGFIDGYEVKVIENATTTPSYEDFTGASLIFKKQDSEINHTNNDVFKMKTDSAGIPAQYRGGSVYVGFHHTANNMDVLYLTNFMGFSSNYQSTIVGIAENNNINAFNLYPNPTSGNVLLSYNSTTNNNMLVEIYDLTGKTVLTQANNNTIGLNKVTLNTGSLNNGIYGYKFIINGVAVNGNKFVVNK